MVYICRPKDKGIVVLITFAPLYVAYWPVFVQERQFYDCKAKFEQITYCFPETSELSQ